MIKKCCGTCTHKLSKFLRISPKNFGIEPLEDMKEVLTCNINPAAHEVRSGDYCSEWSV